MCARTPLGVPDDPFPFEPPFGPPCELVLVGEPVDDGVLVEDGVPPGAELVGVAVAVPDGGHGVVGGGGGGGGVQPQLVGGGVG